MRWLKLPRANSMAPAASRAMGWERARASSAATALTTTRETSSTRLLVRNSSRSGAMASSRGRATTATQPSSRTGAKAARYFTPPSSYWAMPGPRGSTAPGSRAR